MGVTALLLHRVFDTTAELVDYGQPIPVVFGMYLEGETEEQSVGGMVVAPKLVWSRMSSQGQQQTAKLMFVVGEQGRVYTDTQDGGGINLTGKASF